MCVALGALVPCLLGYSVIRHRGRRALFALLALLAGVAVTALSAGLSYGPVNAWSWVHPPVQLGLWGALIGAALALSLPGRVIVPLLMVVLAAQVVLLNTAPQNPYFAATLQSWEQGRFIHFHGLAQWVGWLWPYAAFIYLASRIGGSDGGQPAVPPVPAPIPAPPAETSAPTPHVPTEAAPRIGP
jgi:hypothetical protein